MKRNPIIGVAGSIIIDQGGRWPGYKRAYVNNDYIQSVAQADGIPFIIPVINDKELIKRQVEQIDGLILSGGHDVNPLLYGEEPTVKIGRVFPTRDEFDQVLIQTACELGKPILGICRGIQILNVTFGGTLYQDISQIPGSYIKHDQYDGTSCATHTVEIAEDSFLSEIFGPSAHTNSFHHQAIKDVAPGFRTTAVAKDGVIEAIESTDLSRMVVGVQWHPEMMANGHPKMAELFRKFVHATQTVK